MLQKSLVFIILLIIFYEIYLINHASKQKVSNKTNDIITKKPDIVQPHSPMNTTVESNNTVDESNVNHHLDERQDENELKEVINPNLYGTPLDHVDGKYILWEFREPLPWTKIVYKYNDQYPFYFFIKVKIPSLNDYNNWKHVISNLEFDPKTGELILPTQDEDSALAITNLIISNFKGDISMDDIISKNLIDISINKIKKYDVVKNKIREQIIINTKESAVKVGNKIPFDNMQQNNTSISPTLNVSTPKNNAFNELSAYDGSEFSFI